MDGGTATRIARLAVDAPGDRVLEIGAGTGALTAALLRLGAAVTAFDLDPEMVEVLRSRDDLGGVGDPSGRRARVRLRGVGRRRRRGAPRGTCRTTSARRCW